MNQGYKKLVSELEKPDVLRKGFNRKRRNPFSISDVRINELYDKYFTVIPLENSRFTLTIEESDFDEIVYLLRVHFQLWIEIQGFSITLYREFPYRFMVTKEVNEENHWFSPKTFPIGSILHYGKDHFSVCNRTKGIPLSEIAPSNESEEIQPVVQINYDFIEILED